MLTVLNCFKIISQQNLGSDKINDGASTSKESNHLTDRERCEVKNNAEELIDLMLAEDIEGRNLTELIIQRPDELMTFGDQVISIIVSAQGFSMFPRQEGENTAKQEKKLRYFLLHIRQRIQEIFRNSCIGHYRYEIRYRYNKQRDIYIVRKRVSNATSYCLCNNGRERLNYNEIFLVPSITFPNRMYRCNLLLSLWFV